MNAPQTNPELVNLIIDGKAIQVAKGTNLIEAARKAGIDIPYYCYHPHLSIAGNCRMCQVKIKGAPKMEIACNTVVREGMEVQTHMSSKEVIDAQAATLEFILINHPLDCTVCDQAGHCKLQDYHYDYNARPSRFLEDKVHKVKAEPLGPTVMLDGERCIMCTRCVRFCDEVTKTSELGMLNRGDRSMIAVNQGRELNNPLSGTVVDLCPVGALTHKGWRFNTRIWFTNETDSICPGCSTGCNVKVASRDHQVVQVKARLNAEVNKEWLCDEGRYGFSRFLPAQRIVSSRLHGKECGLDAALAEAKKLAGDRQTVVLLSPDLLLEEYVAIKKFLSAAFKNCQVALHYRERTLTPTEAILISPDYAANFRAAEFSGVVQGTLSEGYEQALQKIKSGSVPQFLLIGERAVAQQDVDASFVSALTRAFSVAILSDAQGPCAAHAKVVLPERSILEKSGLMINRKKRLQYIDRVTEFPDGTEPVWKLIGRLSELCGTKIGIGASDRDQTLALLNEDTRLSGLSIPLIKSGGVELNF